MKFKFTNERLAVDIININHDFLELFKLSLKDGYIEDFEYFDRFYHLPVVVLFQQTLYIVSQLQDFLAVKATKASYIDVIILEGADRSDMVQFILHKNLSQLRGYETKYEVINYLYKFLDGEEGKLLRERLPGDKKKVVAGLLDISETQVQNLLTIGSRNPTLLKKINDGELKFTEALKMVAMPKKRAP